MKIIDWSKKPEIKWEKRMCPLCGQPTGPQSKCHKISVNTIEIAPMSSGGEDEDEDESGDISFLSSLSKDANKFPKVIERNGDIVNIFNEQCIYRQYNNYLIETNIPISRNLAILIGAIEGVEMFRVDSKYRGIITIGNQFNDKEIRQIVNDKFQKFVEKQKNN